ELGLPIASGVIEGACRYLVQDRMDRTGARWGLTGAEAVLRLRSLRASGDFDAYWHSHEQQEYRRNHVARYADDQVPSIRSRAKRSGSSSSDCGVSTPRRLSKAGMRLARRWANSRTSQFSGGRKAKNSGFPSTPGA